MTRTWLSDNVKTVAASFSFNMKCSFIHISKNDGLYAILGIMCIIVNSSCVIMIFHGFIGTCASLVHCTAPCIDSCIIQGQHFTINGPGVSLLCQMWFFYLLQLPMLSDVKVHSQTDAYKIGRKRKGFLRINKVPHLTYSFYCYSCSRTDSVNEYKCDYILPKGQCAISVTVSVMENSTTRVSNLTEKKR